MSSELLSERGHVARKSHSCVWCPEKIGVGEKYVATSLKYDGDFDYSKWHPECIEAQKQDFKQTREDEFPPHAFKRGTNEPA